MSSSLISSNLIPPQAGSAELARNDFQARLAGLTGSTGRAMSPEQKEVKLREACEGFESIFIQKMWQEMRKNVPQAGLLHGREEQFWQGMYDQELAKKMTSAGGIGLADMLYAQLSQNLGAASRATANGTQGSAFEPDVAPLLPQSPPTPQAAGAEPAAPAPTAAQGQAVAAPYGAAIPTQLPSAAAAPAAPTATPAAIYEGEAPRDAPVDIQPQTAAAAPSAAMPGTEVQAVAQPADTAAAANVANSGITLSRMARFEAGSKLGPGAVRPSMRQISGQGQNRHAAPAAMAANPGAAAIAPLTPGDLAAGNALAEPPVAETPVTGSAASVTAGAGPQQAPQPAAEQVQAPAATEDAPGAARRTVKVRYTTNRPHPTRVARQDAIRTLNVPAAQPQAAAGERQALNRPEAADSAATGIPPLTAADRNGTS